MFNTLPSAHRDAQRLPAAVMLLLCACAAPAMAQQVPTRKSAGAAMTERYYVRVAADTLHLRCRPDMNSTAMFKVTRGMVLAAEGRDWDFHRIVPPEGVFYYVASEYVRMQGEKEGVVEVQAGGLRVRAASAIYSVDPNSADVVAKLANGAKVEVLGRTGGWLQIAAPEGVYVYALDDYLEKLSDAEAARYREADAKRATTRPASAAVETISNWQHSVDEVGVSIFEEASKPLAQRDWRTLRDRLIPISTQAEDPNAAVRAARWIELIRGWMAQQPTAAPQTHPAAPPTATAPATGPAFTARGLMLRASAMTDGSDARWYRLMDVVTGRIVYYLRVPKTLPVDDDALLGIEVGVRGTIRTDPHADLEVVDVRELTPLTAPPATQPARKSGP